jgi:5-methylcytosine-specific restriction endonuclease McrA
MDLVDFDFSIETSVSAFGTSLSVREWLSDSRCALTTFMGVKNRVQSGMSLSQAIETPHKRPVKITTVPTGTRRGKLVAGDSYRRVNGMVQVLCQCDCGGEKWQSVREFSDSKGVHKTCGCSRARVDKESQRERRRKYNSEWSKANRDQRREYKRIWSAENPDLIAKHNLYRRRAGADNPDRVAVRDIYKLARSNAVCVCHLCGRLTLSSSERHVDHREAVCRNGEHEAPNLAIACKDCNLRKHAKPELKFLLQEHEVEEPLLV